MDAVSGGGFSLGGRPGPRCMRRLLGLVMSLAVGGTDDLRAAQRARAVESVPGVEEMDTMAWWILETCLR